MQQMVKGKYMLMIIEIMIFQCGLDGCWNRCGSSSLNAAVFSIDTGKDYYVKALSGQLCKACFVKQGNMINEDFAFAN